MIYDRKVSKKLSFFDIRDSHGTTQLVVDSRSCGVDVLSEMRNVPEESTVLVEGSVRRRPAAQQRDVRPLKINHAYIYPAYK